MDQYLVFFNAGQITGKATEAARFLILGCGKNKIFPLNIQNFCNIQVQYLQYFLFSDWKDTGLKSGIRRMEVYCGSSDPMKDEQSDGSVALFVV